MVRTFIWLTMSLLLAGVAHLQAQTIQWASGLDFQYNSFGQGEWGGSQVLGPPNVPVPGSLDTKAFRLAQNNAFGTVEVTFANPQTVTQVIIIESHAPGRVASIALYDENGTKYPIYKGKPTALEERFRALVVTVSETAYKVARMEVNINTLEAPGWSQIDAIGISNAPDIAKVNEALASVAGGKYRAEEELSFSSEKEALGPAINTEYSETKPLISPDGKRLYFVRQEYPDNTGGRRDPQDIYYSVLQGSSWGTARNVGKPLNNRDGNGIGSVTPDGNEVILVGGYDKDEAPASMATWNGTDWNEPEPLRIRGYQNLSPYSDFYMANNGKVLLMAIQNRDSRGDQDIYVSFLQDDGSWSTPKNLGPTINTTQAEFSPFLAADNKTLYFASFGLKGKGSADIFYCKRQDDTWMKWSEPRNLGPAVNTPGFDAYYAISAAGDFAYFASERNGDRNIFRIALPGEFKPEPVLLVKGKVYNSATREPIAAKVRFEILPSGEEEGIARSDPRSGDYVIVLPRGQKYGFSAVAEGFIAVNENIDLTNISEYAEIEKDLYLVPLEVGQVVRMNNLFFEQGTSSWLPESKPELDRLVDLLNENPTIEIELGGHTDNRGVPSANQRLSQDRVSAVKEYLIEEGIAGNRIQAVGYGGEKPIADNRYEETRRLNRRVEIKILKF